MNKDMKWSVKKYGRAALAAFVACGLGVITLPQRVDAGTVTYNFSGIWDTAIDFLSGSGGSAIPVAPVGASVSGFVTVDTSQVAGCSNPSCYFPLGALSMTTGGHTFVSNDLIVNSQSGSPGTDYWRAAGYSGSLTLDGVLETGFLNTLIFVQGTKTNSSILQNVTSINETVITLNYAVGDSPYSSHNYMSGHLTSFEAAVPIPAALPLFASGLAGLGWLSRRRRKQANHA